MEKRLTELEMKISFSEHQLDELNRVVYRQQQQIDVLITEMRRLREQFNSLPNAEELNPRDEIPPHY